MLNVHIPKDSFFTLYARGKIEYKQTVDDLGTFISFDGVVILFYKYPHHRRAYIVRNIEELRNNPSQREAESRRHLPGKGPQGGHTARRLLEPGAAEREASLRLRHLFLAESGVPVGQLPFPEVGGE
jgi:hypothetical protein